MWSYIDIAVDIAANGYTVRPDGHAASLGDDAGALRFGSVLSPLGHQGGYGCPIRQHCHDRLDKRIHAVSSSQD